MIIRRSISRLTSLIGRGFRDVLKENLQISQVVEFAVESHFSRQDRWAMASVPAHLQNECNSSLPSLSWQIRQMISDDKLEQGLPVALATESLISIFICNDLLSD